VICEKRMFLYKYNQFTGQYYQYDMDFYDMFSPMFDEYLHPNDDTVEISYRTNPKYALTCAYCDTKFESRTQLFKHLGYMGINIHPKRKMKNKYDTEKGDCGYFVKEPATPKTSHEDKMDCCSHSSEEALCQHFHHSMNVD